MTLGTDHIFRMPGDRPWKQNTKVALSQLLILFLSLLFSVVLFLTVYHCGNKYTSHTTQPVDGILYFDQDKDPMTYLMNGWQIYRNRLLTPANFTEAFCALPDGYGSIGRYPGMGTGWQNAFLHGSVTYSLLLSLPDTPATYTMELPEIYSAYRLYVGERMVASCGNPVKGTYKPEIHSGSVTFEASGKTRLLLAVSNWSWFYGGLVNPPAFGEPDIVLSILDQKFAWGFSVTVLMLFLGSFQLAMAALQKSRKLLYSALICLAFAVSVCSSPFHRLTSSSVIPFYNLELFCRYAFYGAAILLISHLYCRRTGEYTVFSAVAALFPFAVFGISLSAPRLDSYKIFLLCQTVKAYRIICAFWLLITVLQAGRDIRSRNSYFILLAGTCIFTSSLAAEHLLPVFEPIRFGWYQEITGLIFALIISFLMLHTSFRLYKDRIILAQQKELLQFQIRLQQNHYTELACQMQEIRVLRRDMCRHYNQLNQLLKNDGCAKASNYLNNILGTALNAAPLTFCKNYMVDALLRFYYAKARKAGIPFTIRAELPPRIGVADADISVVLGNILQNALEAGQRIPENKRFLSLTILLHSGNLVIESANAFYGELAEYGGRYRSSKEEGRAGIGISSVRAIAEKYDGNVWIDTERTSDCSLFTIRVLLIVKDRV